METIRQVLTDARRRARSQPTEVRFLLGAWSAWYQVDFQRIRLEADAVLINLPKSVVVVPFARIDAIETREGVK